MATAANVPSQERPRIVVTTDLEVDDMNSLVHLALYLNDLDLAAITTTASQYHFQGDGTHTLGEVNPHWRTSGRLAYQMGRKGHGPDPDAGTLTEYRPFPQTWLEDLWGGPYAQAWASLEANAPGYPTPEELLARTYRGNEAFEGDVRQDTPGSDAIKSAIMDDDPRTLWLLSWGGMNTIVRALMSIAADWQGTPQWDQVREKVYRKVRVLGVYNGVGQDNSWADHGRELFPELALLRPSAMFQSYFSAVRDQADCLPMFQAPWPQQNLIEGNGDLMGLYRLYADGHHLEGEPERYQYCEHGVLDFGFGEGVRHRFNPGDLLGEGDSMTFVPLLPMGLRGAGEKGFETPLGVLYEDGAEPPAFVGNPFAGDLGAFNPCLKPLWEEFAARAAWCSHEPDACIHAPMVGLACPADATAAPGESVALAATAADPDGRELLTLWEYDQLVSSYAGMRPVRPWDPVSASTAVTVPADAKPGDRLVFTFAARNVADHPISRYAQVAVTVR